MYSHFKNNFFDFKDQQQLQMLDPYIELLRTLLKSKWTKVIILSLKVIFNNFL